LSEAGQDEGPPTGDERYMVVSTKQGGMISPVPPVPVPPVPVPPPAPVPCKARVTRDIDESRFSSA
jgi:hypothetical protein